MHVPDWPSQSRQRGPSRHLGNRDRHVGGGFPRAVRNTEGTGNAGCVQYGTGTVPNQRLPVSYGCEKHVSRSVVISNYSEILSIG